MGLFVLAVISGCCEASETVSTPGFMWWSVMTNCPDYHLQQAICK